MDHTSIFILTTGFVLLFAYKFTLDYRYKKWAKRIEQEGEQWKN